ncbi:hypothetical protein BH11MYX3_BH11MYX3_20230 [soil metagenome]
MRSWSIALLFALGCGTNAAGGADDAPPTDGHPGGDADPCEDPADCPTDSGTFVSAMTGAESNPGSRAMPFRTIAAGMAHAKALGGAQVVFVAQGDYREKVTLAEGIDLNGGYQCNPMSCTWSRDIAMFTATITNQDFEGVLAPPGVSSVTLLSGFTILGMGGVPPTAPGSVGVTISGSAPTLRGNKIIGGNVTGGGATSADRSIGVAVRGTGSNIVAIENNEIIGGSGVGLSAAISLDNAGGVNSAATVTANVLRSGPARRSDGISAFGAGPGTVIANNDITSGNSSGGSSNGIETSSPMVVTGNRINADAPMVGTCTQTNLWCAGITSYSATLAITNNVIYGPKGFRTAAVFLTELEAPAGEIVLSSNYLNGGGSGGNVSGTTRNESAGVVVSIGQCNNCGLKGVVGRVRNNIIDGGINLNRYGGREDPTQQKTARLSVLDANDIVFSTVLPNRNDVLYRQVSSLGTPTDIKSLSFLNQMTAPPAQSNESDDPLLDSTWHIAAQSPCINAGLPTDSPGTDFDGDLRPLAGGYDIGPDERP